VRMNLKLQGMSMDGTTFGPATASAAGGGASPKSGQVGKPKVPK